MTTHYFPEAADPALQPFTQAIGMMFAHAAFERRVSELMDVITGVEGFGESSKNQRKAEERPRPMKELVRNCRPDGLPETDAIAACLKRCSIKLYRDRNLLAHGSWWEFDIEANAITVRSGVARRNEDQHRPFTVANIRAVAASLDDLEAELGYFNRLSRGGLHRFARQPRDGVRSGRSGGG